MAQGSSSGSVPTNCKMIQARPITRAWSTDDIDMEPIRAVNGEEADYHRLGGSHSQASGRSHSPPLPPPQCHRTVVNRGGSLGQRCGVLQFNLEQKQSCTEYFERTPDRRSLRIDAGTRLSMRMSMLITSPLSSPLHVRRSVPWG